MNLSVVQWFLLILLDFLSKVACFYAVVGAVILGTPSAPVFIFFALIVSMFHIFFLGIGHGLVTRLELKPFAKYALTLFVAESLFVASVGFLYFSSLSGEVGRCPGYQRCPWTYVTASEGQEAIWLVVFLLVINLLPVLVTTILGYFASRIRRLAQRARAAVRN